MKQLNQLRIDAGLTIADIARVGGVDTGTACRWLSGTAQPDMPQRERLAATLGVAIDELDGDSDRDRSNRKLDRIRNRLSFAGFWSS